MDRDKFLFVKIQLLKVRLGEKTKRERTIVRAVYVRKLRLITNGIHFKETLKTAECCSENFTSFCIKERSYKRKVSNP